MKAFFILLGLSFLVWAGAEPAAAQTASAICVKNGANCVPVDAANPLPVTASTGGTGVSINQIDGNTAAVGNGVTSTGTLRVTISSDSTGQVAVAPLPAATTTNSAASITTGNTFQTVLASNTARRSLIVANNNTNSDSCWLFIGSGTASKAVSLLLVPGGSYNRTQGMIPSDAVQATCTTTADTLYVDSQ